MPSQTASQPAPDLPDADPVLAARMAGLRYVNDALPGIRRKWSGRGFAYFQPDGRPLRDREALERIKKLAIPPAWREVWICPRPNGHLQATGRDARGRKQYRYHQRWRAVRDEAKYGRLLAFSEALPAIRARVDEDLRQPQLSRARIVAAIVRLLERSLIRVGNEEYARANGSYGLTTMRARHVRIEGDRVRFRFRGKSGREHRVALSDRRLARVVRRCQDLPGQVLFQYQVKSGEFEPVDSEDVNEYLRETTGQEFSAKDFRTWAGTVLAASELVAAEPPTSNAEATRMVAQAVAAVSEQLGNTVAVCRRCYIHPVVLEAYQDATLGAAFEAAAAEPPVGSNGLSAEERAVQTLLGRGSRDQLSQGPLRGGEAKAS